MKKQTLYNLYFNMHAPILFFWSLFIFALIPLNNKTLIIINVVLWILFFLFSILYFYCGFNFKFNKYKLTSDELILWRSIEEKANKGYDEYLEKQKIQKIDYFFPPIRIKGITDDERDLLDKIHAKYYGDDWYVTISMSMEQVCYVEYNDIKNKVYF